MDFDDIDWIQAADQYVIVHAGAKRYLLRETLEFARRHTHQSLRRRAMTRSRRALEALLPNHRR